MADKIVDESKTILRLFDLKSEPKRMLPPIKDYENQPLVTLEKAVEPLTSIVSDVEQMVWTVKQNCQTPEDDLTSDESASIMLYTLEWEPRESSFYFILNSTLRAENRQQLRPWFLFLRLIIYSLAKLPTISSGMVYRGIQLDMSKTYLQDKTFIWWAFSSCASSIGVVKDFLGEEGPRTILNIESTSAKDISRHSFYEGKNEILLYPARQFQVISSVDAGSEVHIIQLKEIQPPFPLIHIPQTNSIVPSTVPIAPMNHSSQNQKLKDIIDKYQTNSVVSPVVSIAPINQPSQNQKPSDIIDKYQTNLVVPPVVSIESIGQLSENQKLNDIIDKYQTTSVVSPTVSVVPINQSSQHQKLKDLVDKYQTNSVVSPKVSIARVIPSSQNQKLKELINKCQSDSDVSLSVQKLTDEDMHIVVKEGIINKKCKELWLDNNEITSAGVSIIAEALKGNTTLNGLMLCYNKLGDVGIHSLTKTLSLNNCSLHNLNLTSTGITDEGAGYLAEMLKTNSTLYHLDLHENNIGDRGIIHLANALHHHNNTLQSIDLFHNKLVSDLSVNCLVEMLKHNCTLFYLDINDCNLSEKGKEKLQKIAETKEGFLLYV